MLATSYRYARMSQHTIVCCGHNREVARIYGGISREDNLCMLIKGGSTLIQYT